MKSLLRFVGKALTFDLTRRTFTRQLVHPRLGPVTQFCVKGSEGDYWEAEFKVPNQNELASATMNGTSEGPTDAEEAFITSVLEDLGSVFARCRQAIDVKYRAVVGHTTPEEWRTDFRLDGFEVPKDGLDSNPWEICFFATKAGRYFTVTFESGAAFSVTVDG